MGSEKEEEDGRREEWAGAEEGLCKEARPCVLMGTSQWRGTC